MLTHFVFMLLRSGLSLSRSPSVRDPLHWGNATPSLVRPAFGTSCTGALCCLVSHMLRHAAFGPLLFSFALCSGPPALGQCAALFRAPPSLVRSAFGTPRTGALYVRYFLHRGVVLPCFALLLLSFALRSGPPAQGRCAALFRTCSGMRRSGPSFSRSPCVLDLLHRGVVLLYFAHAQACGVRAPPFLVRPAFGTPRTGAVCCLVSHMLSHVPSFSRSLYVRYFLHRGVVLPRFAHARIYCVHAVFMPLLLSFSLHSGLPA
ncbi:hypothetical protein C8J57DRAFT_1525098 [Mycena rebaudengoi]|nr:hypothetical protein C8J57DRAFT_1525098 [Mycena rebaudengoi]